MIEAIVTIARVHNGTYSKGWVETQVHRFEFEDETNVEEWLAKAEETCVAGEKLVAESS